MSGIRLNEDGDVDITEGKLSLTSGTEATAQRLKQRLSLFFGEWFLDRSRGVPYFEHIFVKNPSPTVIDSVIKREIVSDPAVIELQEFDLDLDTATRKLDIAFKARTDEGLVDFSETFGVP